MTVKFKPWLPVTSTGVHAIGVAPSSSVSIVSVGVSGTIGVFVNGTFRPDTNGAIVDGTHITFASGKSRKIGIDVTSGTGGISTDEL